ncbi:MAG: flagellin FliC3 [Lachnospiraceae bacterium]|nr:flagellin FliC3 [Lachnospiraceae bacterium]
MIINYNVSSMIANNALARNDSALSKSLERLSSGYKINHAKDNAAGLAMSRRMNAQLKGLDVAGDNANDGISIVEIADGAMSEVHDILQRMNELAVKSSNGTLSDEDRSMIDEELQALNDEIERIGETTQFNGQNLLDGSFDLKGYTNTEAVSVDYHQEGMKYGEYTLGVIRAEFDQDGFLTKVTNEDGSKIESITDPDGKTVKIDKVSFRYDEVTLSGKDGFEIKMTLNKDAMTADGTGYKTDKNLQLNLTGIGSMTLQIGANEDQTLELRMPPITKKNLGLSHTDVLTEESANAAIDEIADAISFVSSIRSSLGAYQNRLEHTTTNLDVTSENMTSAYSRIMDVDMATEMTKYSSLQVISQAATSMLAQANERPSQVLQLLQ